MRPMTANNRSKYGPESGDWQGATPTNRNERGCGEATHGGRAIGIAGRTILPLHAPTASILRKEGFIARERGSGPRARGG